MADKKRLTSSQRIGNLESTVEGMSNDISRIESLSQGIFAKIDSLQNTPAQVAVQTPTSLNYEHSGLDSGKIKSTNIEVAPIKTKGCFDILEALMTQFPNKVTVSSPHVKKDGSRGKSFILNMPRIDETFSMVNHDGTTKAQQLKESKELYKAVAWNGYTFTGKYYKAGEGSVFTTYIKTANEKPFIEWLEKRGVHIPAKNPDEAGSEE